MTDTQKKADLAFPTYGQQSPKWWVPMLRNIREWSIAGLVNHVNMSSSALPATSKNIAIGALDPYSIGTSLTSHNRNRLVVQSDADFIFFIDHDTVPPVDALNKLIALDVPMVAGLYFHKGDKHEPIAYMEARDGLYAPVYSYYPGEIMEVDAVGMGCTLIRRDVFKAIRDQHEWFMLSDGSTILVHKDDIEDRRFPGKFRTEKKRTYGNSIDGCYMVEKVKRVSAEDEERFDYPYFTMTHGRTEDMPFCEMVRRVGFPILLDTSIECEHIGESSTDVQDFINAKYGARG